MLISKFNYSLPKELIATSPTRPRDYSRLMIINRKTGEITNRHFYDIIDYLTSNDVLVLNKTKVFPARLFVKKVLRLRSGRLEGGGNVEILFLEEIKPGIWRCLTKPGVKPGTSITFKGLAFECVKNDGQTILIDTRLTKEKLMNLLRIYGHTPIPPYVRAEDSEGDLRKEYQTVYASKIGSVAAPTAGFHFTRRLLTKLKNKGVQIEYITLHVGLGTFAPIKAKNIENHPMHFESYKIDKAVAKRLNKAKKNGKRIISVGTTSTRTLESVSDKNGQLNITKLHGSTNIFIYPGYKFKFIDNLITNFHLPKTTLLALVSAFVSYPNTNNKFKDFKSCLMGKAYKKAIEEKYRFYSFGDSSLIV